MDDRSAQVGWSDAQWNRVRQAVSEEAQRARIAASFLHVFGPLPPSTEVVPSEILSPSLAPADAKARDDSHHPVFITEHERATQRRESALRMFSQAIQTSNATNAKDALEELLDLTPHAEQSLSVEPSATARLTEASGIVTLTQQQLREDDLASALSLFRRAANQVARLEDWSIFNGQTRFDAPAANGFDHHPRVIPPGFHLDPGERPTRYETPNQVALRLAKTNPGGLGLLGAAGGTVQCAIAPLIRGHADPPSPPYDPEQLVVSIVTAVTELQGHGYFAPYACILSRDPYVWLHTPIQGSMVMPKDRVEPLLGRPIVHAGVLDDRPWRQDQPAGVIISTSGDPLDLVVAVDVTPEFLQVDKEGRYIFRVFERFTPRVKDPAAIVRIEYLPLNGTVAANEHEQNKQEADKKTNGASAGTQSGAPADHRR
ncbi:MAG: encapsulin [Chloroflexi bacterium]|nr:encapsulin [Chloroflexota bacterium]